MRQIVIKNEIKDQSISWEFFNISRNYFSQQISDEEYR